MSAPGLTQFQAAQSALHVLHHVGPLADAALFAGAIGKLLFGALGFVLAIRMLGRLRRRTSSWRVPREALAVMAPGCRPRVLRLRHRVSPARCR